jgi:hypothetical protein
MRTFELNEFYRNKKIKFCHKKTLTTFVITFDDDTELELVADTLFIQQSTKSLPENLHKAGYERDFVNENLSSHKTLWFI